MICVVFFRVFRLRDFTFCFVLDNSVVSCIFPQASSTIPRTLACTIFSSAVETLSCSSRFAPLGSFFLVLFFRIILFSFSGNSEFVFALIFHFALSVSLLFSSTMLVGVIVVLNGEVVFSPSCSTVALNIFLKEGNAT